MPRITEKKRDYTKENIITIKATKLLTRRQEPHYFQT